MSNYFTPAVPRLELLMQLNIRVGQPHTIGNTPSGVRKNIPILGGEFFGAHLNGKILPGGGDWLLIRADSTAVIDAKFTLETTSGALISVEDKGLRFGAPEVMEALGRGETIDPQNYFFRTTTRFETSDTNLRWLNNTIGVGSGMRDTDQVVMHFYTII